MPEPIPSGESGSLSRDDLIAIVDGLLMGTIDETDQFDLVDQLCQHFTHPSPFDLIFFPAEVPGFAKEEPTAEEIVAFGMTYQPRRLPREELLRVLDEFLYPKQAAPSDRDREYLLCENLPDYVPDHLSRWARDKGLSAEQVLEKIERDEVRGDVDFQHIVEGVVDGDWE
jgi:hypothetical protein